MWGDYYSVVWSADTDLAQQLGTLSDEEFLRRLNGAFSAPSQLNTQVFGDISAGKRLAQPPMVI